MKGWGPTLARRDLLGVTLVLGAFVALALRFEFSENLQAWMRGYERVQLDELPLALLVLSLGLAWLAWRRTAEAAALLQANHALTQRLLTAQEDERRLLAQELHDEMGQNCTALRIDAAFLRKALDTDPAAAKEAAERMDQSSLAMHSLARDMLKRLRPPHLDSLGLAASLHALCRSWQQQCRIPCHPLIDVLPPDLPDAVCTCLYRVTQEALTNVARHAQATEVWLSLTLTPGAITLTLTDNGLGLPPFKRAGGLGLVGMRQRVASVQGRLSLQDAQPGLRVHVHVPLPQAQP